MRGGRSGTARTVVRRDIFDNTVERVATPPAPRPRITISAADKPSGRTHGDADADFAAVVAEPTTSAEGAKRSRNVGSSPESAEEENKRPCLESPEDSSVEVVEEVEVEAAAVHTAAPATHVHPPASPPQSDEQQSNQPGYPQDSWPRDSTSYAALPSLPTPTPTAGSPAPSYAAAAAAPASPKSQTAMDTAVKDSPRSGHPPITVECLPNWTTHFRQLAKELGHAPNARPLGKGVRFLPGSAEEFRVVQRYLTKAMQSDERISWFCYSPASELPTKVAIRGLPLDTPAEEVLAALQELGFPAERAKGIPPKKGRHGCTFFVQLAHLNKDTLADLYKVKELMAMPGLTIEAWRGNKAPPQCHRCQAFGHASVNCHRTQKCVRCAGEHLARDCPRPLEEQPTCANCGKAHTAKDRRCAVFKKEARKRGISLAPPRPPVPEGQRGKKTKKTAPTQPTVTSQPLTEAAERQPPTTARQGVADLDRVESQPAPKAQNASEVPPTTLAPPANPPTVRGRPTKDTGKVAPGPGPSQQKKKKKKKKKRPNRAARPARSEPAAASTPQPRQPAVVVGVDTERGVRTEEPILRARVPTGGPNIEVAQAIKFFMDALTGILLAYTQGQDIVPAISAGLASLSKLNSS